MFYTYPVRRPCFYDVRNCMPQNHVVPNLEGTGILVQVLVVYTHLCSKIPQHGVFAVVAGQIDGSLSARPYLSPGRRMHPA